MDNIIKLIEPYTLYIIAGLAVVILLLLILECVNISKIGRQRKRMNRLLTSEDLDLESMIIEYMDKVNESLDKEQQMVDYVNKMETAIQSSIQRVGVIRYNALKDVGADLSFAVALLDQHDNGVVINGIYGRESSYTYAKPIVNGTSSYNLSDEEKEAIEKAKQGQ